MGGRKDKNKGSNSISRQDVDLWKGMTKDVRRLPGRDYVEGDEVPEKGKLAPRERIKIKEEKLKAKKPSGIRAGHDVDAATMRKFTRGKMDIEATLDLHGMGQAEARKALSRFIRNSHVCGRRCVLVITGKGHLGRPGVLKAKVPEWLAEDPDILQTAFARPRHGGQGALYVLLRRHRG